MEKKKGLGRRQMTKNVVPSAKRAPCPRTTPQHRCIGPGELSAAQLLHSLVLSYNGCGSIDAPIWRDFSNLHKGLRGLKMIPPPHVPQNRLNGQLIKGPGMSQL